MAENTTPEMEKETAGEPVSGVPPEAPEKEAPPAKPGKKEKGKKGDPNTRVAALESKLEDKEKELAESKNNLLRTAAEYDNYRRRTGAEKDAAFGNGVSHAAEQMLPILDVLYAAADAETTDEEYKKGVLLTLAKAQEVFKKLGIEEIDAAGKPFDPELHNACMQEPCDGVDSGCVTKVMQRGYILNGRVIRHAVVAVAP